MARGVVFGTRFKRRLKRKSKDMQLAIAKTVKRVATNPDDTGLNVHPVQGQHGVLEAYIDGSNRLTFEYLADGRILFRNHCNHDILRQP